MVTGDGYGRWLREKALGLLRSLGFLHFFLYFLHFLYLGMVTGDGYGRRLWAYYVVLVFFISSCIFFIFLYLGMVTGDGYWRRLWAYYVLLVFLISSCIFLIFLLIGDVYGRWLREKSLRGREKARETERDTSNRAFWGGKSRFGTEREREREGERVRIGLAYVLAYRPEGYGPIAQRGITHRFMGISYPKKSILRAGHRQGLSYRKIVSIV